MTLPTPREFAGRVMVKHGFRGLTTENARLQDSLEEAFRADRAAVLEEAIRQILKPPGPRIGARKAIEILGALAAEIRRGK